MPTALDDDFWDRVARLPADAVVEFVRSLADDGEFDVAAICENLNAAIARRDGISTTRH
jgi:hypothetical protein